IFLQFEINVSRFPRYNGPASTLVFRFTGIGFKRITCLIDCNTMPLFGSKRLDSNLAEIGHHLPHLRLHPVLYHPLIKINRSNTEENANNPDDHYKLDQGKTCILMSMQDAGLHSYRSWICRIFLAGEGRIRDGGGDGGGMPFSPAERDVSSLRPSRCVNAPARFIVLAMGESEVVIIIFPCRLPGGGVPPV